MHARDITIYLLKTISCFISNREDKKIFPVDDKTQEAFILSAADIYKNKKIGSQQ